MTRRAYYLLALGTLLVPLAYILTEIYILANY